MTNGTEVPTLQIRTHRGGARPSGAASLLLAVVEASHRLGRETDLERGVQGAVEALRLNTGLDRVYVFRNVPAVGGVMLFAESSADGVPSIAEVFGDRVYTDDDFAEVLVPLRAGRVYQSVHRQRGGANAELNEEACSRSDLMVPVFVAGSFWGIVGFDDCLSERSWAPPEIEALKGAAVAIAAAASRDAALQRQTRDAAALALRDRLLAAVALSLQALLDSNEGGFDAAVRGALGALGTACSIHRVKVFLQRPATGGGELTHYLEHEWWAPGLTSQTSLGLTQFPNTLIPPWTSSLHAGNAVWYLIDDVPIEVRSEFARVGVRSVGAVPIFGGGRYLGCVAFDDCAERRVWCDAEIDALSSAARTIGGAIHRHEMMAETALVNRLLEGVVAASRVLLEDDDFEAAMPRWLCHMGVAIGADRAIFGGFASPANADFVAVNQFEWVRDGLPSVADELVPSSTDFDLWTDRLRNGETIWAQREELNDPVSVRYWAQTNVATNFIVPVVVDRQTVAWLCGDFQSRREWSSAVGSVLRTAADGAAAALVRRRSLTQLLAERDSRIRAQQLRAEEAGRQTERIEGYARLLLAVARSAEELVAARSIDGCMSAVIERLGQATRADRACLGRIYWTPESPDHLGSQEITHEWTRSGAVRQMDGPSREFSMLRSDPTWAMMKQTFETERWIVLNIEACGEPFRTEQLALGLKWSLVYPIVVGGVVWGGLGFDYSTAVDKYDEADLAALQTVASAITEALQREGLERRAFESERARADENERLVTFLQVVVQSSRALLNAEDFEPALRRWLDEIGKVAHADRATYYDFIADQRSGMNTARVLAEWVGDGIQSTVSASFAQPFVVNPRGGEDAIIRRESPHIAILHLDAVSGLPNAFLSKRATASFVSVPIFQDGLQRGCLSLDYLTRRELSAGEVAILQTAAETLVAIFKRNAATQEALAERDRRIAAETTRALEAARHALRTERHSALLSAVAISAEELLATREPAQRLDGVLARIGKATRAQRACVARIDWTPGDPQLHGRQELIHEWVADGIAFQTAGAPRHFAMRRDDAFWERSLRQFAEERRIVAIIAEQDEPFRTEQAALGDSWSLCCPILLEGKIWGLLGFDYGDSFEAYEAADLSALQTVASTIADALARERLELRSLDFERKRADENERLVAMLELVVRSSRALVDADDFEPALLVWLGAFGGATDAGRASFGELAVHEPSGLPTIRILCEWVREGIDGSIPVSFANPYVIDPRGASEAVIRLETGKAYVLHTEDTSPPMRDLLVQQGNQTVITVPIFLDGKQWGCLAFDHPKKTELSSRDAAILQTAADTLAAILKRNEAAGSAIAEREARIAVERRRFSELAHANKALRISLDALAETEGEHGFFKQSVLQIRAQAGARSAYLFSSDRGDTKLRLVGSATGDKFSVDGELDDPAMFKSGFAMVPANLQQLRAHGRLLWRHIDSDRLVGDETPESVRWHLRLGHKAYALHALMVGDRQVGLIGLIFDTDTPPTEAQQELVHTLCQPLTLALELARLATQARLSAEHAAVLGERDRMAAEIHDSLAQSFTSIAMQSESLAGSLSGDPQLAKVLRLIERTAREGLAEARASVLALHPLDAAPGALDHALEQLVERSSVQGSIECRFKTEGLPCELAGVVRESLLRIAQEATSNAMRHSGGHNIRIGLQYFAGSLRLTVEDDGKGMRHDGVPKHNGGFGISGMESRAAAIGGAVSFGRSAMDGTQVTVDVPCAGVEGLAP